MDSLKINKLTLKDSRSNTYYLENILDENCGKLVYLDFLATWCEPCIKAIPHKNMLRDDYINKDIIFISIAIDKNQDEWKMSESFKSLKHLNQNYLIKKPMLSNFIKDNHVDFIPRYFLFSKTGELIHKKPQDPIAKK